jgi:hypothetical protein
VISRWVIGSAEPDAATVEASVPLARADDGRGRWRRGATVAARVHLEARAAERRIRPFHGK